MESEKHIGVVIMGSWDVDEAPQWPTNVWIDPFMHNDLFMFMMFMLTLKVWILTISTYLKNICAGSRSEQI
jgi:hypothetical protein